MRFFAELHGAMPVATTVFLQHEQEKKPTIPTIEIPEFADFNITDKARSLHGGHDDSLIELHNLELSSLEVSSVSSNDSETGLSLHAEAMSPTQGKAPVSKLKRARQPKLTAGVSETCLDDRPAETHSGIVLSPSKLGQ